MNERNAALFHPIPLTELFGKSIMRALTKCDLKRGIAQSGSAPALGAGCREFESLYPDQFLLSIIDSERP